MATFGLPQWPWVGTDPADLPPPERVVLDAGRAWVATAACGQPPLPAAIRVLETESAAIAGKSLDGLLRAALTTGRSGWGCACCQGVTPAETAALLAVSLCQAGARHEALAALLRWLPPIAAYPAMAAAIPLASALRGTGLTFRNPFQRAGRPR
jgi:hypothetical protein